MNKNRKYNKRKDKRKGNYPSPIMRLDDILIAEVRLALQLGLPEDTILRNYHITYNQLMYCKNKKNVSFNDIYKEE